MLLSNLDFFNLASLICTASKKAFSIYLHLPSGLVFSIPPQYTISPTIVLTVLQCPFPSILSPFLFLKLCVYLVSCRAMVSAQKIVFGCMTLMPMVDSEHNNYRAMYNIYISQKAYCRQRYLKHGDSLGSVSNRVSSFKPWQ